jgi:Putative addiction module component
MPVTVESLGIDRLSVRERLDLIEQIWDSLPGSVQPQEVTRLACHGVGPAARRGG